MISVKRMPISRRTFLKGVGAAALTTALINPFSVRGQSSVKLGVIWPLTSATGQHGQAAAAYAAQIVNTKQAFGFPRPIASWGGGIPGLGNAQLELVFADNQSDPDLSAKLVSQLKGQGVVGILGAGSSPLTAAASQAAANEDLPMFTVDSLLPSLTKQGNNLFFRINSDYIQGLKAFFAANATFLDTLPESQKGTMPHNFIWVVPEYPNIAKDLDTVKGFAEKGVEGQFPGRFTFQSIVVQVGETLGDVINRIQALKPGNNDALILGYTAGEDILVIRALAKAPVEERPGLVIIDPALYTLQAMFENLTGQEFGGWRWMLSNVQFLPGVFKSDADFSKDLIGPFRDAFVKNVGNPNPVSALAFTGVHVWAAVLDKAGSTAPQDIVKAAQGIELTDIMVTTWNGIKFGPTSFGDTNANIDVLPVTTKLNEQGGLDVVELPGGFTPSSVYASNNINVNPSCLFNCVAIGINASITAIEQHNTNFVNNYSYDYHTTTITQTSTSTTKSGGLIGGK